jgi:hypothetical protein
MFGQRDLDLVDGMRAERSSVHLGAPQCTVAVLIAGIMTLDADFSRAQEPLAPPVPVAPPATLPPQATPLPSPLLGPEELDWHQGALIPPGYHRVERFRVGFIISGAVVFSVLYFWSAFTADGHYANPNGKGPVNADALYVPVLGPFIQLSQPNNVAGDVFNVIDGLGQAAAISALVYGLASPKTVLVRNDLGALPFPIPYLTPSSGGMTWVGAF